MLARTLLIAARGFSRELDGHQVCAAIARGLGAGGWRSELCPIALPQAPDRDQLRELLNTLDFDLRMRSSRALILADRRLQERGLAASVAFELATRARQSGVPAYAVTAENRLSPFDARILDLQVILEARDRRALSSVGRQLAALL